MEDITLEEMRSAVKRMKSNKVSDPTGVVADMVKAAGEFGLVWLQELFNLVLKEVRIPNDWSKSWMVSVYKGDAIYIGDALDCGSYRGIKLLEHVMKLFERIIEVRIRGTVFSTDGTRTPRGTPAVARGYQKKIFQSSFAYGIILCHLVI